MYHKVFNLLFCFVYFPGTSAGHSNGSVLAVYPEYFWGNPLPADDMDGWDWRRLWLVYNRLHVLFYSE